MLKALKKYFTPYVRQQVKAWVIITLMATAAAVITVSLLNPYRVKYWGWCIPYIGLFSAIMAGTFAFIVTWIFYNGSGLSKLIVGFLTPVLAGTVSAWVAVDYFTPYSFLRGMHIGFLAAIVTTVFGYALVAAFTDALKEVKRVYVDGRPKRVAKKGKRR